jgi:MtrB/PioB family decaheme-associated outer membrane protein
MRTHSGLRLSLMAAAVLAAFSPAGRAAEEETTPTVAELARPTSTINLGAGYLSDDGPRFGQYNGIRKEQAYLLFDGEYRSRNDATGTWLNITGRNLGLESREARLEYSQQGRWGAFLEYGETPRFEPRTAITGLTGIGTGNQTVNGTALRPIELKMKREAFNLGYDRIVAGNWDFSLRFRNEEKNGARLWGQGNGFGPIDLRFLTDPIDYTTRQWEAIAGYTTPQLQLSAGYYGTSFDNNITRLNVANPVFIPGAGGGPLTPMALPPGNQSHQFYVQGGYNITPTTRASFKVAYTHQTQDEGFVVPAVNGRTNLDGRVDTKLAQVGLTASPIPKLSLLANFRYEDKDDKTPVALYFTGVTPTSTLSGINEPRSFKTTNGRVEATYQLPMGFRVLGGVDYEKKERNTFPVRSVTHRNETEEWSYKAELRRSIGEGVTGAVAYIHSDRDGSPFLQTVTLGGAVGSNLIAPIHLADRERDKVRVSVNWMPLDPLNVQFFADYANDKYDTRSAENLGVSKGRAETYSVDATYAFSDKLQGVAYYQKNDNKQDQATRSGNTDWVANLKNESDTFGLGVHGKPMTRLEVGADLQWSDIDDKFGLFRRVGTTAVTSLPDINTKITTFKVYAKYAIQKNMGVRLNYIFDRWKSDDFTWTNWVYTDGTRILENGTQKVHFFGVTGYYQFQ